MDAVCGFQKGDFVVHHVFGGVRPHEGLRERRIVKMFIQTIHKALKISPVDDANDYSVAHNGDVQNGFSGKDVFDKTQIVGCQNDVQVAGHNGRNGH